MTARLRLQAIAIQLAILVGIVLLWRWANAGQVSPVLLPDVGEVAARIPELLVLPRTWMHLRVTAFEILAAFALSAGAGIVVGFWAGRREYLTRLLEPVLVWFQTVPIILIYPICVLIFGLGSTSKIVFAGIYGFFPIALNTMRGLQYVDRRYVRAATSMGMSSRQLTWFVRLPAARPLVMSGIRLGAILNMIGVIAGQVLASIRGLGFEITNAAQTFRVVDLYAFIFFALVLAVAFNLAVSRVDDKRASPA
jgi:ABC-type nitrate/sulfonate/bicarbonate transport system permease component